MLVLMDRGHSREALIWLNWVRLHLQIIFLSDILSALGQRIDPTALQRRDPNTVYSTKKWPKEEPTESDFELWREAVEDICPSWLRIHSVGEFVAETHQIHACNGAQTPTTFFILLPAQPQWMCILTPLES
jgi:hypothetical protein